MLFVEREKSRTIKEVKRVDNALYLYSDLATHRIIPYTEKSIRLSYTYGDTFSQKVKPGVIATPNTAWDYTENENEIVLKTSAVTVKINRKTGCYEYYSNSGKHFLSEADIESRELEAFKKTILSDENQNVEKIRTADGEKTIVKEAQLVETSVAYHTRLKLLFDDKEEIYGLGQHEEGYGSLRGKKVYCHQANRKIAMPLLVSNKGYGLLIDTYSPYIFNDIDFETYIYTEADDEMDFYFIGGDDMSDVIREYRKLTGKAAMLPKWAFGYMQSKERFESREEIERVAAEYRRRNIGIDCLIQDWMSWEYSKWGEKKFDKSRFPDPTAMIDNLHRQNYHYMISIWPQMTKPTDNYKEHSEKGYILPASDLYNPFIEESRKLYWKQASEGLFKHGVDAWWCDSSEPFTPEWNRQTRPDPGANFVEYQRESALRFDATMTNAYGLYHAMGMYEGQRSECDDKRVTNLTRSAYTGAQRYGTILWSGDIAATWDTLKRQIAAGLGFCAAGHPYWTVDIGGFFVRHGKMWYWKGDYDRANEDLGYRELFVRWHQWGSFLPIFRGHGTDFNRELWNFGEPGTPFYDALVKANRLRYELMPYIYSLAGAVWLNDESIIKYLAFDYPDDEIACHITDQYMFGNSIMVCPVTRPIYYTVNSTPIDNVDTTVKVYLPRGKWYDFYTKEAYEGGRYITTEAPLDRIPLFVKAGGIVPMTDFAPSTKDLTDKLDIYVFTGADGEFTYYNDSGDGYGYEKGEYEVYKLKYSEDKKTLEPCPLLEREGVTVYYIK